MPKLLRDRSTGRTVEPVFHPATEHARARVELLVRNPQGSKLADHSLYLDGADALDLVAQITELVANDVPGVVGYAREHAEAIEDDEPGPAQHARPKPSPRRPSLTLMPGGAR